MGGSKQTTQTSEKREPLAAAKPNIQTVLTGSANLAGNLNNFKPQYSDAYKQSLDYNQGLATGQTSTNEFMRPMIEQSGQNFGDGNNYLRGVMNGDPASNPYLNDIIRMQQESTSNAVNGQFSGAGRYGSGAHTGSLTKELGNQELNLRYQDYGQQQGRMDNAAGMLFDQGYRGTQLAPQLDASNYQQGQLFDRIGMARNQMLDGENQAGLRANEYLNAQTLPIAGLGGTSNSTSVTKTPSNPFGMVMGGLQMGAGLMGGPVGGMAGGALGSMFGGGQRPLYGPGF